MCGTLVTGPLAAEVTQRKRFFLMGIGQGVFVHTYRYIAPFLTCKSITACHNGKTGLCGGESDRCFTIRENASFLYMTVYILAQLLLSFS